MLIPSTWTSEKSCKVPLKIGSARSKMEQNNEDNYHLETAMGFVHPNNDVVLVV